MTSYNGEFVSHAPEEESYIFFAEDHNHDYYCRIKRSELERLAFKRIMGANGNRVILKLPTTVCKGTPLWTRGRDVYHQLSMGHHTFTLTCVGGAPESIIGTYDMNWSIRIHNDQ